MVSHNHYDHLDHDSVARLAEQAGGSPRFFVPLGLKDWFARRGIQDVVELDWWESLDFRGLKIDFVPVQHWSKRTLTDENQTLWGGWVIRHPELSFFFAGDAGYSKDFADIRAGGGFDLAAIPIGAYAPRWFMQIMHLDRRSGACAPGRERAPVARDSLGNVRRTSPTRACTAAAAAGRGAEKAGLADDAFLVLRHGETRIR